MYSRIIPALLIGTCLWNLETVFASRILFLSPFASKSHVFYYKSLLMGLVGNNHTLRILSYEKVLGNDYGDMIHETQISPIKQPIFYNFLGEKKQKKEHVFIFKLYDLGIQVCENFLKSPATMHVLAEAKENPFDILLTGSLLYECAVPFAHILSIPRILISSASLLPWINHAVRNPPQYSYSPHIYLPYSDNMRFQERFYNTMYSLADIFYRELAYYPKLDSVIHKYLGPNIPSISDMDPDVSLVLVNSDPSTDYPKANQPNVIQLGGMHINSSQSIPKDILQFIEDSGDAGVIVFTMGSVLRDAELPKEDVVNIVQAFASISQRILWKWDDDKPPIDPMPDNIHLEKWLPQQAILAHPKTKALITHGGLGSCLEAVYHGVPIIGIPVFADQEFNIMRTVYDGSGIYLDINNLTKTSLVDAIGQVTQDIRFRQAMQKRSRILRDKFLDPVKLGVYYIEYAIRHKGAPHLHPAASKLSWFQLYQIDVILVLLGLLFSITGLIFCILRSVSRYVLHVRSKLKKVKKS